MEASTPTFSVQSLRELYAHMEWADARVWSVILRSDTAANDPAVLDTLVHIHLVQRVYLHTWTHRPWELPTQEEVSDLTAIWRWAHPTYREARRFFEVATDPAVGEPLPASFAKRIEESLGAGQICPTVAESAFQVTSHSTHHRGQINTRLRQLGADPPSVDYVAWVWGGRAQPEWTDPVVSPPRTTDGRA